MDATPSFAPASAGEEACATGVEPACRPPRPDAAATRPSGTPVCTVLRTGDAAAWDGALRRFPPALQDIHFSARYHRLYEANGDGEARLFCYRAGAELFAYPFLLRPLPAGLSAAPLFDIASAYGYSGPLSTTDDAEFVQAADQAFQAYCRGQGVVCEFVRFHPLLQNHRACAALASLSTTRLRDYVVVDIEPTESAQEPCYTSTNRNMIRKARKAGLSVCRDGDGRRFDEFVAIYLANMHHLGADPMYLFSDRFFAALRGLVVTDGALLFVDRGDECLAAGVFLQQQHHAHYFLASTTPQGRRQAAGNLLLHEGINWSREQGCRSMHLGGGLTDDAQDPLLAFKRNFARRRLPYVIGRRVHRRADYEAVVAAWERLHPALARTQGHMLQRYRLATDASPARQGA